MTTLLGLDLAGRPVLIVGGGPVAARRAADFAADGAEVTVVAPQVCPELADLARLGTVRWIAAAITEEHLHDAWLVHTSTGDRSTDKLVADWAQQRRIWCINAGDAAAGSARVPAHAAVGGVRLGVLTDGGPDPARAAKVRDVLADTVRCGGVDLRTRRRRAGRVLLLSAGSADPERLTVRELVAIRSAHVIVTDHPASTGVLAELPADVRVVCVAGGPRRPAPSQHEVQDLLIEHARSGRTVVRLTDSTTSTAAAERACRSAGINVEFIPGAPVAPSKQAVDAVPFIGHRLADARPIAAGLGDDGLIVASLDSLTPAALAGLGIGTAAVVIRVALLAVPVQQALAAKAADGTTSAGVQLGWSPQRRTARTMQTEAPANMHDGGLHRSAIVVLGAGATRSKDVLGGAA